MYKPLDLRKTGIRFDKIMSGLICPYCDQKTKLIDSKKIYKKSYGLMYICYRCDAYAGCHQGTEISKGMVANKSLRFLKKEAHKYFDPLWKSQMNNKKGTKREVRKRAYMWLAGELGIEVKYCHIGMMNEEQCQKVIEICTPLLKKVRKRGRK